jgi:hypothetical protein
VAQAEGDALTQAEGALTQSESCLDLAAAAAAAPSLSVLVAVPSVGTSSDTCGAAESTRAGVAVATPGKIGRRRQVRTVASGLPHAPAAPGIGEPAPAQGQALESHLQKQVASGMVCGVCKVELKDSDTRLECKSLRPACQRVYHATCVANKFRHLYHTKQLAVPQDVKAKWRCMACSDICAVCAPATKIGAGQPYYVCGFCREKAHQGHWRAEEDKICFYCFAPM